MDKDVLFTHSYFLRFDPKEYRAMAPYPPLGTLYAASIARRLGYSVVLFDSMIARSESDIIPLLREHRPKIVVIYDDDFNYLTKMCLTRMRDAAFLLSQYAHQAGCTVIVHGSDPTDHLDAYFEHGADYVVCGEGERTLGELLGALLEGAGDAHTVRGIAFRTGGVVQRTPAREVMKELDLYPLPAWDLIDAERYRSLWHRHHGYFSVNMVKIGRAHV
jgi:anaerobic magnesium-protoporphyrin IX monomethyl ester cyclase